ncbi:hypothetical protein FNV43_RR24812 [Rhamnella rubrinervis]|uniref:Glycosyltransferase N-terminal domain-containing protein n=1 Tax=Rhamnella rubrinervis TaxID=2594499 RepID=A0A8K0DT05_9ROSA|nr:hypothetical protein FNV43_RR24812 [Rhamnella rubrinervis]
MATNNHHHHNHQNHDHEKASVIVLMVPFPMHSHAHLSLLHTTSKFTLQHLHQPVSALLLDLSAKANRIVIVHDGFVSSAVQDVLSIQNAESYIFQSTTAFTVFGFNCAQFIPIPNELAHEIHNPIQIPSLEGTFSFETLNFIFTLLRH